MLTRVFNHSYAVLLNAAPDLENADTDNGFATWFFKKLIKIMKREYFFRLLPHLLNDTVSELERITLRCGASTGIFNPFEAMNRMVFHLTMRTVGITDIAESRDLLSRSLSLVYEIGENNSTARIIVSWLPTLKYTKRMIAAWRLYVIINGTLIGVYRPRRPRWTVELGLQCRLGILLSRPGSLLEARGTRRGRPCSAVAKHRNSPEENPLDALRKMSIDDWEHDFPLINLCLHESIRIVTVGVGFRKISSKNVTIGGTGEVIPKGAFAAFHIDQIHMNPDIYTNPGKFDLGRFLPGREEDKRTPLPYAGWGLGRHPCCELSSLLSNAG